MNSLDQKNKNSYKSIETLELDGIIDKQLERFESDTKKHLPSSLDTTSLLLKGHLLSEYHLGILLVLFGENHDILEKTFFEKINRCQVMKILDERNIGSLIRLNKLRNRMAHELEYVISESDVDFIGMIFGKEYVIEKLESVGTEKRSKLLYWVLDKNLRGILVKTISKLYEEKKIITEAKV